MVFVQNWPFFHLLFLGNIGQEKVFYDILERKNAFVGYKNKKFKKSKNWDFDKGVGSWFWSNIGHFLKCFLSNIRKRNVLYVIVEGKKATKKRSEKSRKFKIFAKGLVRGVGPKWAIFPSSYFRQCMPGKSATIL